MCSCSRSDTAFGIILELCDSGKVINLSVLSSFICKMKRKRILPPPCQGLFSSGGPSVRFLPRYDGEVSEPLVGRQGSRVSM